ncbi:hypothetical protein M3Y97_01023900 [Aphelenchoides bicaudatus]|nr:hypothetical protein M3Y97_01023900 [Aphelenchoides bicaudatus]
MIIRNTTNFFSMRGGCGAYIFDKSGRFICSYHKLPDLPPKFTVYDSKFNKKAELSAGPSVEQFKRGSFTFSNKESFTVHLIYPDRALIILTDLERGNFVLALLSFDYQQKHYEVLDSRVFRTYFHSAIVSYGDDYGLLSMKICSDERGKRLAYVFRGFKLESDKIVKETEKELNIDCYSDNEPKYPHLHKQKLWFVKQKHQAEDTPPQFAPEEPAQSTSSDIPMEITPSTSSDIPGTSTDIPLEISEPVPSTSTDIPSTSSSIPSVPFPTNRPTNPPNEEGIVFNDDPEYYYIGYFDLLEERPSEHWVSYMCQKNACF